MTKTLYIIVPCYNEQEVIAVTAQRLAETLSALVAAGGTTPESRILFVDDGSRDKTWAIIREICNQSAVFCGLKLSRNRGHQNALVAGLNFAKTRADITITIDADLQDDLSVIGEFVKKNAEGFEIVCGVRNNRDTDSAFKRASAKFFYNVMKFLGVEMLEDHADFRLMSRTAIEALEKFDEVNLFLRGMVPLLGFKTAVVEYPRHARFAGESKYPLSKMLSFAWEAITSFSQKPIRFILWGGALLALLSLIAMPASVVWYLNSYDDLPLFLFFVFAQLFGAGLVILSVGVVGEYVGKSYLEIKHRPKYIIEEIIENGGANL